MIIALTVTLLLALSSGWRLFRLRRCTSCVPRCANKHGYALAGNEGVLCAALAIAAAIALGCVFSE